MTNQVELKKHRLEQLLDRLTYRKPIKQAIIALESIDKSFQWIGTKGVTDTGDKPVNQETPFFLASIDKMYNAVIIMRLMESGVLNLDEKISLYLPDALIKGLHPVVSN